MAAKMCIAGGLAPRAATTCSAITLIDLKIQARIDSSVGWSLRQTQ